MFCCHCECLRQNKIQPVCLFVCLFLCVCLSVCLSETYSPTILILPEAAEKLATRIPVVVKHAQRICVIQAWPESRRVAVYDPLIVSTVFCLLQQKVCIGISGLSVWSHFSISPLLFFCLVLSLFLSYPFLLFFLAHSPDLFFPKPPFSER